MFTASASASVEQIRAWQCRKSSKVPTFLDKGLLTTKATANLWTRQNGNQEQVAVARQTLTMMIRVDFLVF